MSEPHACPDCLRRAALLGELGPAIERLLIAEAGNLPILDLLRLPSEELAERVLPERASDLIGALESQDHQLDVDATGCWATCQHDTFYPHALRTIEAPPAALMGKGDPELLAEYGTADTVAIVGSRRATSYGREIAYSLARELAEAGALVLSGMAFGVDACAHRAALDADRPTIAVLGCGADIAYPAAHRPLWRRIAEHGLVISELMPRDVPWRWTFPARNRIVAGIADITVVVEAAARSGSLITARFADAFGREVGAVPGQANSRASIGTNRLLATGAHLVRDADDVLPFLPRLASSELRRIDSARSSRDRRGRETEDR